jgi:uroporphyrinogen-III synthase
LPAIYTLSDKKVDGAIALSLLGFEYKKIECDLSSYDAFLITSRNSIKALKEMYDIGSLLQKKLYCIGKGSADVAKEAGFLDIETYESKNGDEFAKKIAPLLKDKKTILLRPKKVISKIKETLKKEHVDIDELVVYETMCKKSSVEIDERSVIIFSSPSSIECFFKSYSWRDDLQAVVIGEVTATHMPKDITYELSVLSSLQECVKIAKKVLDER